MALAAPYEQRFEYLPPGYVSGYELSISNDLVLVDPGIAAIGNKPVFMLTQYTIKPGDWRAERKASTDFYVYLYEDGRVEVHALEPEFSEHVMNKSHPVERSLYLGKITLGSDKSVSSVTQR